MKIPWKEADGEPPVSEEQYQERFWRRRLDGVGLDVVNKEFLAIEFKRTQDTRSNYEEKAIAVAQEQYTSLLTGLQAVGQITGWKVQQLVFVGGTCGSVHVESFNKNMKALCRLPRPTAILHTHFDGQSGSAAKRSGTPNFFIRFSRSSPGWLCRSSEE